MVYQGRVRQGVVVLDGDNKLAEGTVVRVEPVLSPKPGSHSGEATLILKSAGAWKHVSDEVERMLDELRRMKREELEAKRNRPEPGL